MNKGKTVKRKNSMLQKLGAAVVAMLLVISMVLGTVSTEVVAAKDADLDTTTKYSESLGDNASTEYAGRIWTDKTVWDEESTTITAFGGKEYEIKNDSDFLVGYSALATSQSITGQQQAPVDVVFVIDMSGSMSTRMDNGQNRLYNATTALNNAMKTLLALNDYVRVGVIAFNSTTTTILPLDHYDQIGTNEFFTCSGTTLTVHAKGTKNTYSGTKVSSSNGTNIQKGIYEGLNMLATEESTSVVINGTEVKRVPSVILLSDGQPSNASNYTTWWNIAADTNKMTPNGTKSVYGMKAIMAATYMKAAVDRNYGASADTKVYSIGIGITDLSTDDKALAYATINPSDSTLKNSTNSLVKAIQTAWATYAGGGTPTIDSYTFTHPTEYDVYESGNTDISQLYYVDAYYDADDASSVTAVFDDIVSSITISRPEVPTEHDSSNPLDSGYITYTDPIGEYMEVKDMKAIIYAGGMFEEKSKTTSGTETSYTETYVFEGSVEGNDVYGDHELSEIEIVVETTVVNGIKEQVLTIKIPAAAIPIRVNTVTLNKDGTVYTHTNNGAMPVRVLYTVAVQEVILEDDYVNAQLISEEYLAANTNADGTINFYSNLYTGTNVVNGNTAGDATVEFEPAHTNPFYYIQENTPVYVDAEFTTLASADTELDDNTTYYYADHHYHGTAEEVTTVPRTGAQLKAAGVVNVDGYWNRPVGSPRLNRILEFEGTKTANTTNTAQDFYAPTFVQTGATPYDGKFVVYLGNNGLLSLNAGGNLEISKTVTANEGLTAPDKEFEFVVNFTDADGTYNYNVLDASDTVVSTGTIADGGTITLKAGQTARIVNLPPSAGYTVTEKAVAGFTSSTNGNASGTITANETKAVEFVNNYSVKPIEFPTDEELKVTKILEGRPAEADLDTYTFFLSPYNDGPLPTGYDPAEGVTITLDNGNEKSADFGSITFTKPGVYKYTIVEKEPNDGEYLPGISYSRALYRVVITVVDNGDGTLTPSLDIQKLYTDNAEQLFTYDADNNIVMNAGQEDQDPVVFTNTYSADSVTRTPIATKIYTDYSDANPLVSGMFQFKLEPVGYYDGTTLVENPSVVPMPLDSQGNKLEYVITTNEGENVTFPSVTFHQTDILSGTETTYVYKFTEVLPEGATTENNYTVNGMTYDASVIYGKVTVSMDANSDVLAVNAEYSNGDRIAHFTNSYKPEAVKVTLEGTKTMVGRDMLDGETFKFNWSVTDNDAFTGNEFRKNMGLSDFVLEPEVSGGTDGNAVAINLGQLEIRKPGTYYFTLSETIPKEENKAGGVTYDEVDKLITIVVIDNNGKLEATVSYDNGGVSDDTTKAVFVNTYDAADTDPISISGKKNMTGKELEEGKFFFEITPINGAPMGARTTLATPNADGTIDFLTNVTYSEAGTYEYIIREQIPANAVDNKLEGITYDDTIYRVTVTVTDNQKGKLEVSYVIEVVTESVVNGATVYTVDPDRTSELTGIEFNNVYTTTSATVMPLELTKVLSGYRNEGLKAGEFTFKAEITNYVEGSVVFGTDGKATATNNADGSVQFPEITFVKPGTYTFEITEVVPAEKLAGVTYDTHKIVSTFVVVDNGLGSLVATRTEMSGSRIFTNVYETTGSASVSAKKVFTGRAWEEDDEFTFVLEANNEATRNAIADGTVVLPVASGEEMSITINKDTPDYTKAFEAITFNAPGTYEFRVREVAGSIAGVVYDGQPHIVTVVLEDQGDATLTAEVTIKVNGKEVQEIVFTNVYDTENVVLTGHGNLHVTKVLTGREWLDTDEFTFELALVEGDAANVAMSGTSITVTKDNKDVAHFGNITFSEAGTYVFEVKEVIPTDDTEGITYDNTIRKVTVVVTENTAKAVLEVAVSNLTDEDYLTFVNEYETTSVDLKVEDQIQVTKELTGRNWTENDSFTFVIEAKDDETKAALIATGGNKAAVELEKTEVTVNAENKTLTFGNITFNEPGVYTFLVSEVVPAEKAKNMSYDGHQVTVIFTVEDNLHGELEITDKAYDTTDYIWTNVYTPNPANVKLEALKAIQGREWKSDDVFTFLIAAADGTPMPSNVFATTNADHKVIFETITYNKEGVYKYYISEVGTYAGLTTDSRTLVATVTVENNMEGDYVATVTYAFANEEATAAVRTFVNTYSSVGELDGALNLKVTKNFTGRPNDEWLSTDSFTFKLAIDENHEATKNALAAGQIILPETTLVVTSGNRANAHFGNIVFKKAGTYQFIVTEEAGSIAGVSYDTTPRTVIVKVTDNWDGTLTAVLTDESSALVFNNTYRADGTFAGLEVTKNFTGREWLSTDSFTFVLEAADAVTEYELGRSIEILGASQVVITSATPDQKASFGDMVFEKVGTYTFIVREVKPVTGAIPGVEYDGQPRLVTITVTDNGDATLTAEAVITVNDEAVNGLVFTNVYKQDEVEFSGHNNLHVEKVLSGRAWTEEDSFEFTIEAYSDNAKNTELVTMVNPTTIKADANNKAYIHFGDIIFREAGEYQFLVKETIPANAVDNKLEGITYDTTARLVTVEVENDYTNAVLVASVKSVEKVTLENGVATVVNAVEDKKISFTNIYDADDVTLDGSVNLEVTKRLVGRNWDINGVADKFSFTITAHSENAKDSELVTMDGPTAIDVTSGTKKAAFGDIVFHAEGTYVFKISEVNAGDANMTYDTSSVLVTVEVVDDGKGNLVATPSYSASLVFTNTYTPSPIDVSLEANKVLVDDDNDVLPLEEYAGKFTFVVSRPANAGATVPHVHAAAATEVNDANGKVEFVDVITFTEPGTYVYYINEVEGDLSGITYDNTTIKATITVTYDASTGKLVAAAPVYSVENAQFTNKYSVVPVEFDLAGQKVVDDESDTYQMEAGDFEFELIVDENNHASDPARNVENPIKNAADGSITILKDAVYTEAGTYKYYVEELDTHIAGFNYDHAIYEIIVEVVDEDAKLVVASYDIKKYEHGVEVEVEVVDGKEVIVFTNKYHEQTDTEVIEGIKNLTGKPIADGEFQFKLEAVGYYDGDTLVEETANVPMPENVYAQNIGHLIRFEEIEFGKENLGKFVYEVSEVDLKVKGYEYDDDTFRVTIEVREETTSEGHKDIVAYLTYPEGGVVFDNIYVPKAVKVELDGTKTLTGHEMEAGEFDFTLTPVSYEDEAGTMSTNVMDIPMPSYATALNATVSNSAAGEFTFGDITFTKTGTYRYTITEDVKVIGGVTFDRTSYDVVVVVTDEGFDGQLDAEVTFYVEDKLEKEIAFVNEYNADPAIAVLEGGFKTLHGRPLRDGEFKFHIEAVSGPEGIEIPMPEKTTVANDVIGNISFGVVEYEVAGEYKYKISEVDNGIYGVDYDEDVFEVTVNVVDDGEGQLVASVSGMVEVDFENTYTPDSVEVKVQGLKAFNRTLKADEFTFIVLREGSDGAQTEVKNDVEGKIVFINESFSSTGKYTYYFMEAIPEGADYDAVNDVYSLDGVVYDAVAYKYTFTVKDDENGKLYVDSALTTLEIVDRDTLEVVGTTNRIDFTNEYIAPKLVISKKQALGNGEAGTANLTVKAGDVVTYFISVENTANYSVADDVVIKDTVESGLNVDLATISDGGRFDEETNTISWEIAELKGGETKTVSFQVVVPDVEVDTTWENVATVIDNDIPEDSNEVVLEEGAPAVSIVKTQKVGAGEFTSETLEAQVGETVTYNITVTNNGSETAENIVLSDEIPAGLVLVDGSISDEGVEADGTITWVIGNLEAGAAKTVSFQVTVPKVDNDTEWTNVATATYDNDPDEEPENSNEVTVETEYVEPELDILKEQAINDGEATVEMQTVVEGDVVTYYITITNTTDIADAKEVVIRDEIPAGLTLVEGSISEGGTEENGIITWNVGTLTGGTNVVVSFKVTVPDVAVDTTWENMATVTQTVPVEEPAEDPDDTEEKTEESNVVEIEEGTPDLEIAKLHKVNGGKFTDQVVEAKVGDKVTYSITVTNNGSESAYDITISDIVPIGLVLVDGSISKDGNEADGVIVWTVEELAIGESVTVSFKVAVPKIDMDTEWTNVATVVYENDPTDPKEPEESNEVTVETEYVAPELVLVKKQAVNDGKATTNNVDVEENDVVTYFITVTNKTKTTDAKEVVVKDLIPVGLELVAGSISNGGAESEGVITWNLGTLAGGEEMTVSFQVRVPDVAADTTWENVAIVTQTVPTEDPEDNPEETEEKTEESNEVVAEEGVPSLVISKVQRVNLGKATAEKQNVRVGDVIIYSIIVTNEGTEAARDITIVDQIPAGLKLVKATITKDGTEQNGVITWEVDSLEAGASVIVSFAVKVPSVSKDTEYKNIATVAYGNEPNGSDKPQESNEVEALNETTAPKTGDETNIAIWVVVAGAALVVCVVVLSRNKKRNEA